MGHGELGKRLTVSNILQAVFLAMHVRWPVSTFIPDLVLVDGSQAPKLVCPVRMIIGGDNIEPLISAASIVAKVTRDRLMVNLGSEYPSGYGFKGIKVMVLPNIWLH